MNLDHYYGPVVYFATARALGQCKIGCTDYVRARAQSLGTNIGTPVTIEAKIPGTTDVERFIHLTVWKDHAGGEWFNLSAEVETMIFEARMTGKIAAVFNNFHVVPQQRISRWKYIGEPMTAVKYTKSGKPRSYALKRTA